MKTYEVLFVTPHGNGWAIINSDTVNSVRSILENQSKFQPLDILHIKERKVICGLNTSIIYEGHCETLMSPYDLAVSQGYEGSLEEWLESLKGESAYEIWLDQGHIGTEEDFLDWLRELSSTSLQELNDVNVDSPSYNQALIYNNTTQKWENKNIPEGSLIVSFTEDSNSIICNVPIDTIVQASHDGKNIVGRYAMNYQQYLYYIYGNVENFVDGYIRFTFNVSQDSKSVIIEGYKSGYHDRWHKYGDFYYFTQDYKNKLEGIESGAQVNVQSDWNESDSSSDAFIRNRPTIPTVNNATLTIQKNGTTVDTFTANASVDKTINITVPTTAADVNALPSSTKYCASLLLSINSSTYVITAQLKDQDGNNLGTAQTIDLPLESVVVSGSYDSTNKKIVLTLQNGNTIDVPVGDLISGLQTEITTTNKLSADLIQDGSTNKVYTSAEKTKLASLVEVSGIYTDDDWTKITIGGVEKNIPQGGEGGSSSLSGLNDVNFTSLANGQMLQYNSTSQKWENVDIPSDAFICTLTETTVDDTTTYSCDKTSTDIKAAANSGKVVLMKWSASGSTMYLPINTDLSGSYNMIVFGGLTSMGLAIAYFGIICIIDNGVDVWDVDSQVFNQVAFTGDYSDLSNLPTLGTAAALDVAASGNASATQVVKGDDTRLTDSRPASDVSAWAKESTKPSYTASEVGAVPTTQKGANGGVAELDSNGKVPSSQLPSYVDDVLEYASQSAFPATGESGKIYIALDTNKTYRWSGSAYVEISESLALGETSSTAYAGNKGKANADAIAAIKDGTIIDSFGDVETALADKINKSSTSGLVKNDGTIDTNTYLTQHQDISGKANKSEMSVVNGTGTDADKTTITLKNGTSATVLKSHQDISGKQDTLVSGTNIKTINNESVLGSGNINIVTELPSNLAYTSNDNGEGIIPSDGIRAESVTSAATMSINPDVVTVINGAVGTAAITLQVPNDNLAHVWDILMTTDSSVAITFAMSNSATILYPDGFSVGASKAVEISVIGVGTKYYLRYGEFA